jgi:3-deoxy-manno-octulosonate cytidylyltransferase (CMP-KDO synthetase)
VYHRVRKCQLVDEIVVATDDIRIFNHVNKFGGKAMITRIDHESGTNRCAEVLQKLPGATHVINVQGDEPLIHPKQIDDLIRFMASNKDIGIGTLIKKIDDVSDLQNPSKVKVVIDKYGKTLYFSRSAIPFVRDVMPDQWLKYSDFYKHIGMYGFRTDVLRQLALLDSHPLERTERLEQLNWLVNGFNIYAHETELESIGVDTPEDAQLIEHLLSLAEPV